MNIITEELSTEEFNDEYFPRIDLSNKARFEYFKYKGKDFAYDKDRSVVIYLFKDEDELEELGNNAPWRKLDSVGLNIENWKNKVSREEYLDEYILDLEEEDAILLNDFIKNELHLYNTENNIEEAFNTKTFELEFTVDGTKSSQQINAMSMQAAEDLIKKQYEGKNIIFNSKKEIKEAYTSKDIEVVKTKLTSMLNDDNTKLKTFKLSDVPQALKFLSTNGVSGVVLYNMQEYAFAIYNGKVHVMRDQDAGWNWSETLYKMDENLSPAESKYSLSEDLFESNAVISDEITPIVDTVEIPEGPAPGSDSALSNLLIDAINDEWETIRNYNDLLTAIDQENKIDMKQTILDIVNEENIHVGQLQALLETISPNTSSIKQGQVESEDQLQQNV